MDLVLDYEVDKLQYLTIGQEGENNATIINIDMTTWVEALTERGYNNICCHLLFKPYNATVPVEVGEWDRDTNILTWTVSTAATAVAGLGYTEIRAFNHPDEGLLLKKSKVIPTMVNDSVSGVDSGIQPAPYDDWINQILIMEDNLNQALGNVERWYVLSTGYSEIPGDTADWSQTMPALEQSRGRYLWTKTVINWNTGGHTNMYNISYIPSPATGAVTSVNNMDGDVVLDGGGIKMNQSTIGSPTVRAAVEALQTGKFDAAKIVYSNSEPSSPVNGMIWLKPKT